MALIEVEYVAKTKFVIYDGTNSADLMARFRDDFYIQSEVNGVLTIKQELNSESMWVIQSGDYVHLPYPGNDDNEPNRVTPEAFARDFIPLSELTQA
jgi:hypothetical protein